MIFNPRAAILVDSGLTCTVSFREQNRSGPAIANPRLRSTRLFFGKIGVPGPTKPKTTWLIFDLGFHIPIPPRPRLTMFGYQKTLHRFISIPITSTKSSTDPTSSRDECRRQFSGTMLRRYSHSYQRMNAHSP